MRAGFADPVLEAQQAFRAVLDAVARPGRIVVLGEPLAPPPPLHPATAAVALALFDFESPLWLDVSLGAEAREWLAFHTGAPFVERPGAAAFGIVTEPERLSGLARGCLDDFDMGTDERPDRSATLVIQVAGFDAGAGRRLTGPGILGEARLAARGLRDAFWEALRENHGRFPRGVDVLLTAGTCLVALPRTTRISASMES
jgi:alpha-D-ribose 1-methylphosphonate 5-triphosphate synthase subunit PhnH